MKNLMKKFKILMRIMNNILKIMSLSKIKNNNNKKKMKIKINKKHKTFFKEKHFKYGNNILARLI